MRGEESPSFRAGENVNEDGLDVDCVDLYYEGDYPGGVMLITRGMVEEEHEKYDLYGDGSGEPLSPGVYHDSDLRNNDGAENWYTIVIDGYGDLEDHLYKIEKGIEELNQTFDLDINFTPTGY